jgi:hypothetical protein
LEDVVKDAVLEWVFPPGLFFLVEIALDELTTGRAYFASIREEPVFYRRYFKRWVTEAMEERNKLAKTGQGIASLLGGAALSELNGV